ncbi:MAG: RDD family protein [Gammaproteobacteria bacterium]|nr:RDD family protein [Gammaproteobacteria bacterium]
MSENPYASSATISERDQHRPPEIVLASRFKRLIARIVDGFVEGLVYWAFVSLVPGVTDFLFPTSTESSFESTDWLYQDWEWWVIPDLSIENMAYWLILMGITFICQAYLLAEYGQTVGKRILKIRIVKEYSSEKPPLSNLFVVRECGVF